MGKFALNAEFDPNFHVDSRIGTASWKCFWLTFRQHSHEATAAVVVTDLKLKDSHMR